MYTKKLYASVGVSGERELLPNNVDEMFLEYYIVEEDFIKESDGLTGKTYGAEVVKTVVGKNQKINIENKIVHDISTSEQYVKQLIGKFAYHKVTPITLVSVLEDILGMDDEKESFHFVGVA